MSTRGMEINGDCQKCNNELAWQAIIQLYVVAKINLCHVYSNEPIMVLFRSKTKTFLGSVKLSACCWL